MSVVPQIVVLERVPAEAVRGLGLWLLGCALVTLLVWRPLVRRTGWARWPTLALMVWTLLVLSMTLPLSADPGAGARLDACVNDRLGDLAQRIVVFGSRGTEDFMNVALWLPCGLLGVLATRRAVAAPVVISAGFVVVELLQPLDAGRWCDPLDWAYNSFGVAAGAALAVGMARLRASTKSETGTGHETGSDTSLR
jgi:hypothetical protein